MAQRQSGANQGSPRAVPVATEADEAAATANAALAQMRRNFGEIGTLYSIIDEFHERIAIVNRRAETSVSQTEQLLTERSSPEVRATSKRVEVSTGEDRILVGADWPISWQEYPEFTEFDTSYRDSESEHDQLDGGTEL